MPRKKKNTPTTDVLVVGVLDRSGSMASCLKGAVEGWNDYLKDLQADTSGETFIWLTGFDTEVEHWEKGSPIGDVPFLTTSGASYPAFVPRGNTALYDAIANSIVDAEKYLKEIGRDSTSENPMKVLHITLTDGEENASKEYSAKKDGAARLRKLTKSFEDQGNWSFIYLGAEHDAYAAAATMGYAGTSVAAFSSSVGSYKNVSSTLGNVTGALRSAGGMNSSTLIADAGATDMRDTYTVPITTASNPSVTIITRSNLTDLLGE